MFRPINTIRVPLLKRIKRHFYGRKYILGASVQKNLMQLEQSPLFK